MSRTGWHKKYTFFILPLLVALCGACANPQQRGAPEIPLQNRKDLASSYVRSGNFNEALAEMAEAEKQSPGDREVHLLKGIAHFGLKDFSSAEKSYKKALELDGSYTKARYTLCGLHLTMNKPDSAIRQCETAAQDTGYSLRYAALVNIARAYDMKGDPESAERFFKKSLLIERSSIYSRNEYGKFLAGASRHSEAASHFSAALKLAPGHNEARLNLAASLMETGETGSACAEIEKLLKNKPAPALEDGARAYAPRCGGAD